MLYFQKYLTVVCSQAAIKTFNHRSLCWNVIQSYFIKACGHSGKSVSVCLRHVCPIPVPLAVANPVSGFTKNKTKMWSGCWTHQHDRAGDQEGWAAHVILPMEAPAKVCMQRGPQQQHRKKLPASRSDFFRCSLPGWWTNVGRKISFTINNFRPFSLLPALLSPKESEMFKSSALLWTEPTRGRGPLLAGLLCPVTRERPQPAFAAVLGGKEAELSKH